MKKLFLIAGIFALMSVTLNAQVTIGKNQEPNPDAVLELVTQSNNKGFLPPRIALVNPHNPAPLSAHVQGMVVYNTNINNPDSLREGLYVNNGIQWVALRQVPYAVTDWFYMPSFPVNVSAAGTFQVDLWEKYSQQFDNSASRSIITNNSLAPLRPQPKVYIANELNYYVTGYDNTVFTGVSLTNDGKLNYTITTANLANVSDSTFINIVLTVK